MTILFITESRRRATALDITNLGYVPVWADVDENLLPICTPKSEAIDLATEMSEMKIEEFVKWYTEVYPLTNRFDRLWADPLSCDDKTILKLLPPRIVIASHTLIEDEKHLMGKTCSPAEMREALFRLRDMGSTFLHTSISVHDLMWKKTITKISTSTVNFRFDVEDALIENYINTGEPFEGDGSFLLNGRALFLVRSIMGEPLVTMGLPLTQFHLILREQGIDLSSLWIK